MNHNEIEDKIALRELVDKLSILADKKDYSNLVQSFTEDGIARAEIYSVHSTGFI